MERSYEDIFLSVYDSLISNIDYDLFCSTDAEHATKSKELVKLADLYARDIIEHLKIEG